MAVTPALEAGASPCSISTKFSLRAEYAGVDLSASLTDDTSAPAGAGFAFAPAGLFSIFSFLIQTVVEGKLAKGVWGGRKGSRGRGGRVSGGGVADTGSCRCGSAIRITSDALCVVGVQIGIGITLESN